MGLVQRHPGALFVASLLIAGYCTAEFTSPTSFANVVKGQTLELAWDHVDPKLYPLSITVQLIDKGSSAEQSVTGYKTNVTTGVNGTSFPWHDVPYPLHWVSDGLFAVEVRGGEGSSEVVAKSPFFAVTTQTDSTHTSPSPGGAGSSPSSGDSGPPGMNQTLALALGLSVGAALVIVGMLGGWCYRKRHSKTARETKARVLEERRRRKRKDFVIE